MSGQFLPCGPGSLQPTLRRGSVAAILAMHPSALTVIDRQAYKALGALFRDPIPVPEYLNYVRFCREHSDRFGVTMREYDQALWQSGSDTGSRRKPK